MTEAVLALRLMAVMFFSGAAYIDWPRPGPTRPERNVGNFCCSVGFVFLALAELLRGMK